VHIGNIANNAYLAARKERQLGIEAHVISLDYTHIMGFPEWEEIEIHRNVDAHFMDNFENSDFQRPLWFHYGSLVDVSRSIDSWFSKTNSIESRSKSTLQKVQKAVLLRLNSWQSYLWRRLRKLVKRVVPIKYRARVVGNALFRIRKYLTSQNIWNEITDNFDYVTFYGPSASLGNYIKKTPYITLEHGTLRDYVDSKYLAANETKRGFINAQVTLVTNQDCLPKAIHMNLKNPLCTPHPINDDDFKSLRDYRVSSIDKIRQRNVIVVPARHTIPLDVDIGKGSEIIYSAIEVIAAENKSVVFELVEWGDAVPAAKERLRLLEDAGQVHWNNVMSRPLLKKLITTSTAIIDQLKIPAYGAITADALGIGTPVITRHSCLNDVNFFESCAPVLAADSVEALVTQIRSIINKASSDLLQMMNESTEWFDANLSSDKAHSKRLEAYAIIKRLRSSE